MELNTFVRLYQEFLHECTEKGWMIEILIEEFGNYLAAIKNSDRIEVQFFMKLDLENCVQLSDIKNQSKLQYGVIRPERNRRLIWKRSIRRLSTCIGQNIHRGRKTFILYKP